MATWRAGSAMLLAVVALVAGCGQNPTEVGFIVGEPTGFSISTQIPRGDTVTFQGGLGGGGVMFTADWLLGRTSAQEVLDTGWMFYWGVGVRLATPVAEATEFGVRVSGGLTYDFAPELNALLFAEVAPGLAFGTGFTLDWGIGLRWPF
jgi:hypothetical protein